MSTKIVRKEIDIAGRKLTLETGELAPQASAAILASYGETVVLATAVAQEAAQTIDYFPLSVEYEEKLYAGGKISTSRFIKRENRPTEVATLTARLIDRSIRPLFPKDYQEEVQVIIIVLSVDQQNDPDILSLIAASAALSISDIPFSGPIAAVRVGLENPGSFILNPTKEDKQSSSLNLLVACNKKDIVILEAEADQVDEKHVASAMDFGLSQSQAIIKLIEEFTKDCGKEKKQYQVHMLDDKSQKEIKKYIDEKIMKDFQAGTSQDENWFSDSLKLLEEEFVKEESEISGRILANILEEEVAAYLRDQILVHKKRPDGRSPDDIRDIAIKVGVLPRTHGSAIFQRGKTQALSIVTLGSPALEQLIEGIDREETKRYMHHYNFPPFSVGETGRRGAPGRREIGHGALAEKAVLPVIPENDKFPYTIRIVSEILSSAGSTSMAAVCGSTLSLIDAGVPIK